MLRRQLCAESRSFGGPGDLELVELGGRGGHFLVDPGVDDDVLWVEIFSVEEDKLPVRAPALLPVLSQSAEGFVTA